MAIALQRFSTLIAAIYTAGDDPDRWEAVVREITDTFGAVHTQLVLTEPATGEVSMITAGAGFSAPQLGALAERVPTLPTGATVTGADLFAPWEQGLLPAEPPKPDGLSDCFVARLTEEVPPSWICLAMPDARALTGESAARTLLGVLVPHLRGALHTHSRLVELSRDRDFALATLEKAKYGIMIVTADSALVFANAMAEEITGQSDGLTVDASGRLRATAAAAPASLCALIRQAAGPERSSGNIALPRASGGRPLIVRVTPLDGVREDGPWQRAVLLLVVDPEHDPEPEPTALHDLYGLTDAETMVAMGVLRGDGLPAVADQLSVSLFTARTHLQHIFAKTRTHRQAELVRLLLTSAISAQ
ncbi:helix-turn-helix transcriptional regulator [Nocardia sp. AG03]|uniref:helix-turn-helix transcriptional regulator n=1 Tax=Nocardia sp. AG03 TaxID=3025312 RepID=UPI00241828A2|nr:helix-turn-helix transcriptional regulator [Nocardia sp. AG03]